MAVRGNPTEAKYIIHADTRNSMPTKLLRHQLRNIEEWCDKAEVQKVLEPYESVPLFMGNPET